MQTLPANLKAEQGNPNVEFVVLDYGSEDGLGDWIKQNFSDEIASGRLRYARLDDAEHFKFAHAKNMAHRLATGDVLCNVDADNYIAPNFSRWLTKQFTKEPLTLVTLMPVTAKIAFERKVLDPLSGRTPPKACLGGRVALSRQAFDALGGYDENYSAYSGDDVNLTVRARELGMKFVALPPSQRGDSISHDNAERIEHLSSADKQRSLELLKANRLNRFVRNVTSVVQRPEPQANPDGRVGCGDVRINFAEQVTTIEPLTPKAPHALAPELQQQETSFETAEQGLRTDWAASLGDAAPSTSAERKR